MPATDATLRSWAARLAVIFALVGALMATVVPARTAYAADDGGFAAKMLELLNQNRAAAGVAPLQAAESLRSVAQDGRYDGCGFPVMGRADDMGSRNYFSHTILNCGTQGVSSLLNALGVQTSGYGENIAWMNGTTDPIVAATRLVNDFMASPGHKANILDPDFTHVGIGSWRTAAGQTWAGGGYPLTNVFVGVQVFGRLSTTSTTAPPTTAAPAVPNAPTSVVATGGDGVVNVSWAPATSGPAVDAYGAFIWDSNGYTGRYAIVGAGGRSATVTGLANGRPYYATVQGHNAGGWGVTATSSVVTVAAVPGTPTELRAVPGNGSITASWKVPTNPGTLMDGFGVFVFDSNGVYTEKSAWTCATCSSATVPGLVNGRTYYAVVYAHNANGWGTPVASDMVIAGTPGPVATVHVTPAVDAVNVTWSPAPTSTNAVDLYGMFAFDANGYTGIYTTACGTCTGGTLPGLATGHTYVIAVFAHNGFGWGVPTLSASVVPS